MLGAEETGDEERQDHEDRDYEEHLHPERHPGGPALRPVRPSLRVHPGGWSLMAVLLALGSGATVCNTPCLCQGRLYRTTRGEI
jgi:hypothetical protein